MNYYISILKSMLSLVVMFYTAQITAATVESHYFQDYGSLHPANTFADSPIVNSTGGITQLAIDISGATAPSLLDASDFTFRIGNSSDPASWDLLTATPTIQIATGAGVGGSDRITFDWSFGGSITGTWIEVTTEPSAHSGLAAPDYFYAGSLVGDANRDLHISSIDALLIINSINAGPAGGHPATINDPLDINRDGFISAIDALTIINLLDDSAAGAAVTTQLQPFTPREKFNQNPNPNPVPLPQSIWLFLSGIVAFLSVIRKNIAMY